MFKYYMWPIKQNNINLNSFYASRYYIHVNIKDRFLDALVKYARGLAVGDPMKQITKMGPVVSKAHYDKIQSYIQLAIQQDNQILCGETIE